MKARSFTRKPVRIGLYILFAALVALSFTLGIQGTTPALAQDDNPNPPDEVVKLIFIHHSCGENWLEDEHGGLGRALGEENYFVSDTNYGWGPDYIGDRTDILDWPEWFRGSDSGRILEALYNESGQNSAYTRNLSDPGGENQIIMFKSCFPNSELEGNPNDAPSDEGYLSVATAKYIYNDLLAYFETRPDKLFVVITAPPIQDASYAANARAFNTWLVRDWLAENNYPYSNVAVWDFYNVLTDPDNHHRYNNGVIEYITDQGADTLYYDSDGDNHPNPEGDRKATEEFLPVLNIYYHRWVTGAPSSPPPSGADQPPKEEPTAEPEPEPQPAEPGAPPGFEIEGDLIDDFETGAPAGTEGWEAYWDEATETTIDCAPDSSMAYDGSSSLRIDFDVAADSWATCGLFFAGAMGWGETEGVSFYLHTSAAPVVFDVDAYRGRTDDRRTYLFTLEAPPDSADDWVLIELPWEYFLGADWEEDAGNPVNPNDVHGIGFGFSTYPDTPNTGTIWVDDLRLMGAEVVPPEPVSPTEENITSPTAVETPAEELLSEESQAEAEAPAEPEAEEEEGRGGGGRLCGGSMALGIGMALLFGVVWVRKRYQF